MLRKLMVGIIVGIATVLPFEVTAQRARVTITPQPAVQATQTLALAVNKSQVLRVSQAVSLIAVGNAEIVDTVAFSDRSFYVLGKGVGTTNITVYEPDAS
jgi:pilus assembly protein CpaC